MAATITAIKARQIFDSRGNPTVEVGDQLCLCFGVCRLDRKGLTSILSCCCFVCVLSGSIDLDLQFRSKLVHI